jgi:hypothetical protein
MIDPVPSQFCSPRLKSDIESEAVPVRLAFKRLNLIWNG